MLTVLVLSAMLLLSEAKISEIPLPGKIKNCFEQSRQQQGKTPEIGEVVFARCVHRNLWTPKPEEQGNHHLGDDAKTWIKHLLEMNQMYDVYEVKNQASNNDSKNEHIQFTTFKVGHPILSRQKRQSRQPRVRKEYRLLSRRERDLFHRAVNMLKQDRSVSPNKFDALGRLHYLSIGRGHNGPNFFPWHRLFLVVFENALREKIPSVTVPYWDSTLDSKLLDPRSSVMWTPEFMGTANGYVTDGPFANWVTPMGPMIRYFGTSGTMLNWTYIKNSFRKNHLKDITSPYAHPDDNLEDHHNQVHLWVGGHMAPPALAAFDPVFYLLHSFTDLLWEIFRGLQKRRKVDPTVDYPQNRSALPPEQAYNDPSGFGTLLNRHALSDVFIDNIYKYERPPYCSRSKPSCGSDHIRCDMSGSGPKCVSASIFDIRLLLTGSGLPMSGGSGIRETRSTRYRKSNVETILNTVQEASKITCSSNNIDEHYVNSFDIDGVRDISNWVYIPIKIVYTKRQQNLSHTINTYDQCKNKDATINAARIFIESNGISYRGMYKEIVTLRRDLRVTQEIAYLALKRPTSKHHSDVLLTGYDACGRVCQPYCYDNVTEKTKKCSGAIRVTDTKPLQFENDVMSASSTMWHEHTNGYLSLNSDTIFLSMVCSTGDSFWPW